MVIVLYAFLKFVILNLISSSEVEHIKML